MINKKILLATFVAVSFSSCKKTYQCWCTNDNGSYLAGEIEGTKRSAKKQCAKLGVLPTTCDIR